MGYTKNSLHIETLVLDALAGVPRGATLTLGLSGGVDSVTLFHLLHAISLRGHFSLRALHVHHHLHSQADTWEAFCRALCARLGVAYTVRHVVVPRDKASLEGEARRLRYAALQEAGGSWVALAHHRDDQAETVMLNFLRGAGVRGVAAMPLQRTIGVTTFVRPLLSIDRISLEALARSRGWTWVEDASNYSPDHRRNRLRHEIIPAIKNIFPQAAQSLARGAAHFQTIDSLLDDLAAMDWQHCAHINHLTLTLWRTLSAHRRLNLLRHLWLWRGLPPPSLAQLQEGERQFLTSSHGSLRGEGLWLRAYRDTLYISVPTQEHVPSPRSWQGEREMAWAGGMLEFALQTGQGLRHQVAQEGLEIRVRQGGEKISIHAQEPRRDLKYIFQQHGIPPWLRPQWPLIYKGERLLAVSGLAVAWQARCLSEEMGWQMRWVPENLNVPQAAKA